MVRKLFFYTGIVIWHFEKALKKKKNPEISIFVTIFVEKILFWAIFHCGNGIRQRIDYYPENIVNHNFVRYPNRLVWKLSVYFKLIVTYFCKPKTR